MKFVIFILPVTTIVLACNQPVNHHAVKMTKEEIIPLISKNIEDYGYENIPLGEKNIVNSESFKLLAKQGYVTLYPNSPSRQYVKLTGKGLKYAMPSLYPELYKVRTATLKLSDQIDIKDTLVDGRVCTKVDYQYLVVDFTPFNLIAGDTDRVIAGTRTYGQKNGKWELLFGNL